MKLRLLQLFVLVVLVVLWYVLTAPGLLPNFYFDQDNRAAFFFGEPAKVFWVIVDWFATGEIFRHLAFTLLETVLGFVIGSAFGLGIGLWLALSPTASAVLDPYIKGFNSMPRVVLAPIFAVWFGLGIWSKVALGVTLVFFVVFFNVYQGVREVSPTLLANARLLADTVSPRSVAVIKRQIWEAEFQTLAEATVQANHEMELSFRTADFKEGVAHFLEKRAARFTGR